MLSRKEAIRMAIAKYDELWGEETVDEWVKHHSVGDSYLLGDSEIFEYTVDQDDNFGDLGHPTIFNEDGSVTIDESTLPAHRTHFRINRTTGEMEITEHW